MLPELLEKLLEGKDRLRRLDIVDEHGKLQGIIPATALAVPRPALLDIATTGYLVAPVAAIPASASEAEADEHLQRPCATELRVVECESVAFTRLRRLPGANS
jgi:hypothetical protein